MYIISLILFTILVLVAVITTLLATPLYRLFYGDYAEQNRHKNAQVARLHRHTCGSR
jgi:hypothetical protein